MIFSNRFVSLGQPLAQGAAIDSVFFDTGLVQQPRSLRWSTLTTQDCRGSAATRSDWAAAMQAELHVWPGDTVVMDLT